MAGLWWSLGFIAWSVLMFFLGGYCVHIAGKYERRG